MKRGLHQCEFCLKSDVAGDDMVGIKTGPDGQGIEFVVSPGDLDEAEIHLCDIHETHLLAALFKRERNDPEDIDGACLIGAERYRQIREKGYDAEHDDKHDRGALALAATFYAAPETLKDKIKYPLIKKPKVDLSRLDELIRAGALIAAEIDRLRRVVAEIDRLREIDDKRKKEEVGAHENG